MSLLKKKGKRNLFLDEDEEDGDDGDIDKGDSIVSKDFIFSLFFSLKMVCTML